MTASKKRGSRRPSHSTARPEPVPERPSRWRWFFSWGAYAAVLAWIVLSTLNPVLTNDIWVHLRIGQDVLASHQAPQVDVYSAVAAGRPFISHEWLAGVVFALVDRFWTGGVGLSALNLCAALGLAAMLYLSAPKAWRGSFHFIPLLVLCLHLVFFRLMVRPHLFSLLALSAFALGLERWRRTGRWRDLLWLVPVETLWANLHGSAPFGPVVLVAMTTAVALAAGVSWLAPRAGQERTYGWRDVGQLGATTGACVLAMLVNPYGPRLFTFSLFMAEGNEYIKKVIFEWGPTWTTAVHYSNYWFWSYVVILVLAWLSLLAIARTRPVVDFFILAVVTYLSCQAQRFTVYVAIFGFPMLVRNLPTALGAMAQRRGFRRRPLFELLAVGLLILWTIPGGYPQNPREKRPIGWGYGGRMPYAEIKQIKEGGYRGVMFNEYADGAPLIYALHPQIKPVMDSRIDIYGEQLFSEYQKAASDVGAFFAYLRKYHVNLVMRFMNGQNRFVYQALEHDPAWRLAFRTNSRFLFVARDAGY